MIEGGNTALWLGCLGYVVRRDVVKGIIGGKPLGLGSGQQGVVAADEGESEVAGCSI
jgi:hypothetical protein